jgi:hypothetical protein
MVGPGVREVDPSAIDGFEAAASVSYRARGHIKSVGALNVGGLHLPISARAGRGFAQAPREFRDTRINRMKPN